ncbi:HNH endonuclease [Arthrobacter sp. JSM 101049]|uniref:HNH endonuclease n=1 Tax=Arthrobacter sp. JSM 101049 TaxID=929097 RepID=UPI00356A2CD8
MPIGLFIVVLIGAPIVFGGIASSGWVGFLAFVGLLVLNPFIWKIRRDAYFKSAEFQQLRSEVTGFVAEHNDVVNYVEEIREQGSFDLGTSSTGQYAHLATFENNSAWNNRRDRNVAEYTPHVHNASLQVVRNASANPIKYLMKYFSIKADQETLADVQRVSEDISRLEQAVGNVKGREAAITAKIDPPAFILKRYAKEFWDQVGIHLSPITVPYPQYKFQYTSAGGNSGQSTGIRLDVPTLEALAKTLVQKIRWAKSAAGQRALMTARLRGEIKARDHHTCQNPACGISVAAEPHLLLEVDHILPVSKGGLSTPDNLQTLCWRCNRTKGAKLTSKSAEGHHCSGACRVQARRVYSSH